MKNDLHCENMVRIESTRHWSSQRVDVTQDSLAPISILTVPGGPFSYIYVSISYFLSRTNLFRTFSKLPFTKKKKSYTNFNFADTIISPSFL